MKVSWLVLTYNRGEKVKQAMEHNLANQGEPHDELVWVDNGSTDGVVREVMAGYSPDVSVLHKDNRGVAAGYNRAMALASCEFLVITGCDMLMPDGWLRTFKEHLRDVPGIACMYHRSLDSVPERARGMSPGAWIKREVNGRTIIPAMPIERRMFSRELLGKIGFLREDFGLYGWEDVEWAYRAERVCATLDLPTYVIPGMQPIHLGTEGVEKAAAGGDESGYHSFKQREANDPRKREVMRRCQQLNWPYYNPLPMPWKETDSLKSRESSLRKFAI